MADHKEAISVTEMAKMVGLGRTRFYQLVADGIFPPPERDEATRLPLYSHEQQEICINVRRRNCGVNGKLVVFRAKRAKAPQSKPSKAAVNEQIKDLVKGLRSLGLADVTLEKVNEAVKQLYPDGMRDVDFGDVFKNVFVAIHRPESNG